MKKFTKTLALFIILMISLHMNGQNVLFVRGGDGSGGFFEPQTDPTEQLAGIFNNQTFNGNHGWGQLRQTLENNGFTVTQVQEGAGGNSAVNFAGMNLSQYDVIVLGSNNAQYNTNQVNAVDQWVRNGGGLLTISDANFGSNWCDAPNSDQSFLSRYGIIVNQDFGTYVLRRNNGQFINGGHPILNGINAFDGEGVSPFTVANNIPNGVTVNRLVSVPSNLRQNNGSGGNCQGSTRSSNNRDAVLITATAGNGRVVGHYDRNTFFNQNGAGTNINRFDNRQYAINLFTWLANTNTTPIAVTGIVVSPATLSLTSVGATSSLSASVSPSNAANQAVTWTSNNTTVATVSASGVVTAVANGSATITATTADGGFTDTSAITVAIVTGGGNNLVQNPGLETGDLTSWGGFGTRVVDADAATGSFAVKITGPAGHPQTITVQPNTTYTLSANVKAQVGSVFLGVKNYGGAEMANNITSTTYTNSSVTFTTGATNTSAQIYLYTGTAGNIGFGDDFSVVGPGGPSTIDVTGVSVSPTTVSLLVGETENLSTSLTPANATNQGISWSSSNTTVATVNGIGVVTAVAVGNATITATTTDGGFTDTSTVTVNESTGGNNLVLNPGLETGDLVSWGGFGTRVVDADANIGSFAVKITGSAGHAQIINVQPNTTYTLSANVKTQIGNVFLGVKNYGGAETANNINSATYISSSLDFTTGTTNTSAEIYLYTGVAGNVAFGDDFSVVASGSAKQLIATTEQKAFDNNDIKLYPNPAQDQLQLIGIAKQDVVSVRDLSGRTVIIETTSIDKNMKLDVSRLQNGIYILMVRSASKNTAIQFMKN